MNDVCIFGEMQALDANNALLHLLNGDMQIMKLAEDCYWTIVVFSMAHEIAHAYLAHIGKKYSERHLEKEEYDADAIAYDIVLKIIMKESNEEPILEKYTYLAPAMYMDFLTCIIIQTVYCIRQCFQTQSIQTQLSEKESYLPL